MTVANYITIFRILLIPVFVLVSIHYVQDFQAGIAHEWQRWLSIGVFALASVSDAIDGLIARRFNQKTELGAYLDPLADKCLLITALIFLSRDHGGAFDQLPLWFPVLVISRDAILLIGMTLIHMIVGKTLPRPRVVGKCATFFQIVTLGWVLLKIQQPSFAWPLYAAGLCTLTSGIWYIIDGIKALHANDQNSALSHRPGG